MKTIRYFLLMGVVALILLSSNCKDKNDNGDDPKFVPSITLSSPQSAAFDVGRGETVNFGIEARANSNSKKDINKLYFKVTLASDGSVWDTTWYPKEDEKQLFKKDYAYQVPSNALATEVITVLIQATDVDNQTGQRTIVMAVKDLSGLNTYNDVELGAQNNVTIGQFYATSINTIYKIAEAKSAGQTRIDFVYIYNNFNPAVIVSPDNSDIFGEEWPKISNLGVHTWATRNATKFKRIVALNETEWEILTATKLKGHATGAVDKKTESLFDGSGGTQRSYIAFLTRENKAGVFRVKEVTGYDGEGTIIIDVKVEK